MSTQNPRTRAEAVSAGRKARRATLVDRTDRKAAEVTAAEDFIARIRAEIRPGLA